MRSLLIAAIALVATASSADANVLKAHHFHHLFHMKHFVPPPAPPPPSTPSPSTPSAPKASAPSSGGGGHNSIAPYIAGAYYGCVNVHAVVSIGRAKKVRGVKRLTYREGAAIFGDCALPIPIFVDGRWRTVGGEFFWWLGGRDRGYSDPDFAIKQRRHDRVD